MSSTVYNSTDFKTDTQPTVLNNSGRLQYTFDQLLARQGTEFHFLDYLFSSKGSDLCGAVGTVMRPVSEQEVQEQKKIYKDYEHSPITYLYHEENSAKSWDEWIDEWFCYDGYEVMFDLSYSGKYEDAVRNEVERHGGFDLGTVALVECIGGGRMFGNHDRDEYDEIYDHELFRLAQEAEENGLSDFY